MSTLRVENVVKVNGEWIVVARTNREEKIRVAGKNLQKLIHSLRVEFDRVYFNLLCDDYVR